MLKQADSQKLISVLRKQQFLSNLSSITVVGSLQIINQQPDYYEKGKNPESNIR